MKKLPKFSVVLIMGPKTDFKERGESSSRRSSRRLAERARLEKLQARQVLQGGRLPGNLPIDPLDIPDDDE